MPKYYCPWCYEYNSRIENVETDNNECYKCKEVYDRYNICLYTENDGCEEIVPFNFAGIERSAYVCHTCATDMKLTGYKETSSRTKPAKF